MSRMSALPPNCRRASEQSSTTKAGATDSGNGLGAHFR
jgi:hypothetical protein